MTFTHEIKPGYRFMTVTRDGRLIVPEDNWGYDCPVLGFPFDSREEALKALEDHVDKGKGSGSYVLVEQFSLIPNWDKP